MVNSRSLDDLDPRVKTMAESLIETCREQNIDLLITSTYRDNDCQQVLYQKGRSVPGTIVTNAKPGESFHNYRLALDFCPLEDGKCAWGDSSLFTRIGVMAEGLGMEWAGRWSGSLRELAHVQWTNGLKISDLQNGKRP